MSKGVFEKTYLVPFAEQEAAKDAKRGIETVKNRAAGSGEGKRSEGKRTKSTKRI